jgi:hypothetical protein
MELSPLVLEKIPAMIDMVFAELHTRGIKKSSITRKNK